MPKPQLGFIGGSAGGRPVGATNLEAWYTLVYRARYGKYPDGMSARMQAHYDKHSKVREARKAVQDEKKYGTKINHEAYIKNVSREKKVHQTRTEAGDAKRTQAQLHLVENRGRTRNRGGATMDTRPRNEAVREYARLSARV